MDSLYPGEYNINISETYFTFLKQISEDYKKYVTNYKMATSDYLKKISLNQEKYGPQLLGAKEQPKDINVSHIISLTSIIPKIIKQQIINIECFIDTIDSKFNKYEKLLKNKTNEFFDCQNLFKDFKNELNRKYKEIDQIKNSYISSITLTEETIHNYYMKHNNKKKKEFEFDSKIMFPKTNTNELNYFFIEEQLNSIIRNTKKIEEEYKSNIDSAKSTENNYMKIMTHSKEEMRKILCEVSSGLKELISESIILLRNTYKIPLKEIDIYLDDIIKVEEFSVFNKDIIASYKGTSKLKPIVPEKYTLKMFQVDKRNIRKSKSGPLIKNISFIEENFQEMDYLQEEVIFKTIKKMKENFELIEKINFDLESEEEKLRCKYLTWKILSFADDDDIFKNQTQKISDKEIEEIHKMLLKKQNRVIFIQQLSQFRTRGIFNIPQREYDILSRLFNIIAKTIESDKDYDSAINIIILSQTYYVTKDNKKVYLQNAIMNNELFKNIKFWETYVNYAINKELNISKEADKKNGIKNLNEKEIEEKMSNIVFSQLIPISDNMIEFGLDVNVVEEIILPLIKKYKISPEFSEIVLSTINAKKQELLLKGNK